jgi:hypothetical protein
MIEPVVQIRKLSDSQDSDDLKFWLSQSQESRIAALKALWRMRDIAVRCSFRRADSPGGNVFKWTI